MHNAIVWQDRRTAEFCEQLKADGAGPLVQRKTGLLIDAYFSASKIRWILDHVAGARERARAGRLAFGTVDTWLIWKLTGGREHVTDVSNASRTMLFDIHSLAWDNELLELFDIPASLLPRCAHRASVYGETSTSLGLGQVPIAGIAGDQQSALFGQMCRKPGHVEKHLRHRMLPAAEHRHDADAIAKPARHHGGLATRWPHRVRARGQRVHWRRRGPVDSRRARAIRTAADIEPLALAVPDNGGVFLVPAFAGLGAPHWDPFARGAMVGSRAGRRPAHIARAALESIAFQVADLLDAMAADCGIAATELRVDGGASANDTLMQIQADLLGVPVVRPAVTETTALGAAYLAGLGVGFWTSADDLTGQWRVDRRFEPQMAPGTARACGNGGPRPWIAAKAVGAGNHRRRAAS